MKTTNQPQDRNRMTSPWFPTRKTREELLAERDSLGSIISGNYLPYIAKMIDAEVDPMHERYRQIVIPASMEEVHQYCHQHAHLPG